MDRDLSAAIREIIDEGDNLSVKNVFKLLEEKFVCDLSESKKFIEKTFRKYMSEKQGNGSDSEAKKQSDKNTKRKNTSDSEDKSEKHKKKHKKKHKNKPDDKKQKRGSDAEDNQAKKKQKQKDESYHNKKNESNRSKPDILEDDDFEYSEDDSMHTETMKEQINNEDSDKQRDDDDIYQDDVEDIYHDEDLIGENSSDEKNKETDTNTEQSSDSEQNAEKDPSPGKANEKEKSHPQEKNSSNKDSTNKDSTNKDSTNKDSTNKNTSNNEKSKDKEKDTHAKLKKKLREELDEEEQPESEIPKEPTNDAPPTPRKKTYDEMKGYYFKRYNDAKKNGFIKLSLPMHESFKMVMEIKHLYLFLKAFETLWSIDDAYDTNEKIIMARINMGLSPKDGVSLEDVQIPYYRNVYYPLVILQARFNQAGLIDEEKEEAVKVIERIKRLYDLINGLMMLVFYDARTTYRLLNKEKSLNPTIDYFMQFQPMLGLGKLKKHQKFLYFIMNKLRMGDYRRKGEYVYKAKWTPIDKDHPVSYFTNTWEPECTIQEFVDGICDSDTEGEAFKDMSAQLGTRVQVANFLTYVKTSSFPDFEVSRYLLAYKTGIYNISKDLFVKYEDRDQVEVYEESKIAPIKDLRKKKKTIHGLFGSRYACAAYHDVDFIEVPKNVGGMDIPTDALDAILEWQLQKYPREQVINIMGQYYGLLGRSFFWGGERDNMQIAVYTYGKAGTGKSSIYETVMGFYPIENLGIISSNCERQWTLSSLCRDNAFSHWGTEIGDYFGWDQNEFQLCVTLEYLSVAKKHMTAFTYQWMTHIFLAGNKFPSNWKNQSDNLKRRLAILECDEYVPLTLSDSNLAKKLKEQSPLILQKLVRCYGEITSPHPVYGNRAKQSFWKWCDPYFKAVSDECFQNMHPLVQFLKPSEGQVDYTPTGEYEEDEVTKIVVDGVEELKRTGKTNRKILYPFCSKKDFENSFIKYLKFRGLRKENFMRKYYEDVFKNNDTRTILCLRTDSDWKNAGIDIRQIPEDKRPVMGQEYFYGLKICESVEQQNHYSKKNTSNNEKEPPNHSRH
jgi:hypothetical protein